MKQAAILSRMPIFVGSQTRRPLTGVGRLHRFEPFDGLELWAKMVCHTSYSVQIRLQAKINPSEPPFAARPHV